MVQAALTSVMTSWTSMTSHTCLSPECHVLDCYISVHLFVQSKTVFAGTYMNPVSVHSQSVLPTLLDWESGAWLCCSVLSPSRQPHHPNKHISTHPNISQYTDCHVWSVPSIMVNLWNVIGIYGVSHAFITQVHSSLDRNVHRAWMELRSVRLLEKLFEASEALAAFACNWRSKHHWRVSV
jgi:hypothetical protein